LIAIARFGFDLHARASQRKNRLGNSGPVHRFDPAVSKVGQPRSDTLQSVGRDAANRRRPILLEARTKKMFL